MTISGLRRFIQISSTVICNSYVVASVTRNISTSPLKGICVPVLNCYACPGALFSCPLGAFQHFAAIRVFPWYLLGCIGLVGIIAGRMSCGWICPFGLLQELMHKIRSRKFGIPQKLTYVKYLILAVFVVLLPLATGDCWFSKLCPAGTLTAGIPWVVWNPTSPVTGRPVLPFAQGYVFYASVAILLAFLAWFVVSKRPFCRVVCPMGAILSIFNGTSLVRLTVSRHCDGCGTCSKNCPVDLDVTIDANAGECIRCMECTQCGDVSVLKPFKETTRNMEGGR